MALIPGHCIGTENEVLVSCPRHSEEDWSRSNNGPSGPSGLTCTHLTGWGHRLQLWLLGTLRRGCPGLVCLWASVGKSHRAPNSAWLPLPATIEDRQPRTCRSSVFQRSQKQHGVNFLIFNILCRPNKTCCWDRPDPWTTSSQPWNSKWVTIF